MTWSAVLSALVMVAAVSVGVALAMVAIWPLQGLVSEVWKLPMLLKLRPGLASAVFAAVSAGLLFVLDLALPVGHASGKVLAAIVLAAWPAHWMLRQILWRRTNDEARSAAAAVRRDIGARDGGGDVRAGKAWPTFVFDLERARRRETYDPPPI